MKYLIHRLYHVYIQPLTPHTPTAMCIICNQTVNKDSTTLYIEGCNTITTIPAYFSNVKVLVISKCANLQSISHLASLKQLVIVDCPSLANLPEFPRLTDLSIYFCKVPVKLERYPVIQSFVVIRSAPNI